MELFRGVCIYKRVKNMQFTKIKSLYKWLILIFICSLLLFFNHYYFSYSRRIGNTRFYLVETMVDSKDGKPLVGLYYKPIAVSGYCGENTPGFPKTIYWNNQYVISQNYDGKSPDIIEYVIINLDSIDPNNGEMKDIHRFRNKEKYYTYLKQIKLSEADMNQTDNHIAWWEILF